MNALLARNYFNDALPAAAPIGPPAGSYIVFSDEAHEYPGASHIIHTGPHDVLVFKDGRKVALDVPLCGCCDAPLIQGFCKDCM